MEAGCVLLALCLGTSWKHPQPPPATQRLGRAPADGHEPSGMRYLPGSPGCHAMPRLCYSHDEAIGQQGDMLVPESHSGLTLPVRAPGASGNKNLLSGGGRFKDAGIKEPPLHTGRMFGQEVMHPVPRPHHGHPHDAQLDNSHATTPGAPRHNDSNHERRVEPNAPLDPGETQATSVWSRDPTVNAELHDGGDGGNVRLIDGPLTPSTHASSLSSDGQSYIRKLRKPKLKGEDASVPKSAAWETSHDTANHAGITPDSTQVKVGQARHVGFSVSYTTVAASQESVATLKLPEPMGQPTSSEPKDPPYAIHQLHWWLVSGGAVLLSAMLVFGGLRRRGRLRGGKQQSTRSWARPARGCRVPSIWRGFGLRNLRISRFSVRQSRPPHGHPSGRKPRAGDL